GLADTASPEALAAVVVNGAARPLAAPPVDGAPPDADKERVAAHLKLVNIVIALRNAGDDGDIQLALRGLPPDAVAVAVIQPVDRAVELGQVHPRAVKRDPDAPDAIVRHGDLV